MLNLIDDKQSIQSMDLCVPFISIWKLFTIIRDDGENE